MELGAVLEAVAGRGGGAEAVEQALGRYNEENRAVFRFDPADEEKRKRKRHENPPFRFLQKRKNNPPSEKTNKKNCLK